LRVKINVWYYYVSKKKPMQKGVSKSGRRVHFLPSTKAASADQAMSSDSATIHHTSGPDVMDEWTAFQTTRGPPPEEPDTSDPVAFAAFRKLLQERIEAKNKWMAEHPSPEWEGAPRLKSLDALGSVMSVLNKIV
jgi:hypothetical protein